MDKSKQEIWEEILRTAQTLKESEFSLESMEKAICGIIPLDEKCLPVHYVADAQILTNLILRLKESEPTFR